MTCSETEHCGNCGKQVQTRGRVVVSVETGEYYCSTTCRSKDENTTTQEGN